MLLTAQSSDTSDLYPYVITKRQIQVFTHVADAAKKGLSAVWLIYSRDRSFLMYASNITTKRTISRYVLDNHEYIAMCTKSLQFSVKY